MMRLLTNRWLHFLLLFGLLYVFIIVVHPENSIRQRLQFIVFDHYFKTYTRQSNHEVVVVDINDESLEKLGQWPWPRKTIGSIIQNINKAGASVIAFDGVLAEPDRTSPDRIFYTFPEEARVDILEKFPDVLENYDAQLAEVLKEEKNFVAGFTHGLDTKSPLLKNRFRVKGNVRNHFLGEAFPFRTTANFLPELVKEASGNGSFMASPEIDNVIRRTYMVFSNHKELYPSLAGEAVRVYQGSKAAYPFIKVNEDLQMTEIANLFFMEIGDYKVPLDITGQIWIYYQDWRKNQDEYYYPAMDFNAEETALQHDLDGKIVIIASSAEGLKDLRSTPLGFMPGVEIHVNAIEQILNQQFITRPLKVLEGENTYILIVGGLLILLSPFVGLIYSSMLAAISVISVILISFTYFSKYGILIDPVYPSLSILLIFGLATILNYLRVEQDRKHVREAFGLYISPDFMKELTKNPEKLQLGGEIKPLTVMFTDIRSFTTISEGLTPQELIQLMNDFLTPMSDLVMQNRGTIDKYMGDAMMAFWNAPLDDENHERHACITALQMNKALGPINEAVKKKAAELGKEPVLLNAGIGINTGPCAVGNMGSKQRFAYSTLGDAVNLASRLEGQTKNYGINILIGHETYKAVPDFAALEFDLIQVKGKNEPVHIYALLGDQKMAESASYQELKKNHDAMIEAYRSQNFKKVIELCEASNALEDWHLEVFYNMYIERAKDLIKNPPGKDWDGVFVATSK